ncbi:mechanosensitive ion channel family protein [Fluviispira multicolorata]|uniref:Mechanosensitive ion channel n=1 Tax=Fluviispira multicolorata TaxID=2654512 RepID=A0A833N4K6_9BACT|nr:mechanosensitive ion channel family protein [Fluviispira multicolorata]KAB8032121.1 mechanosensitive ion channel [Fluviispira multicolorata]
MYSFLQDKDYVQNIFTSVIIFLTLLAIRFVVIRQISQLKITPAESKRNITVRVKNAFIIIIFFSLVTIWSSELKTIALSFVAIAAALAIATKEFTLCFVGGFYKWIAKPFSVGDRIEIASYRGDVVDYKFLTTTLLEIGPITSLSQYTGRTLIIPNSVYLTYTVSRESHLEKYIFHAFIVPLASTQDWRQCESHLLFAAKEITTPYLAEAKKFFNSKDNAFVLGPASLEPRVSISLPTPEQIDLIVRIPCPCMQTNRTQQAILRRYLELSSQEVKIRADLRSGATIFEN